MDRWAGLQIILEIDPDFYFSRLASRQNAATIQGGGGGGGGVSRKSPGACIVTGQSESRIPRLKVGNAVPAQEFLVQLPGATGNGRGAIFKLFAISDSVVGMTRAVFAGLWCRHCGRLAELHGLRHRGDAYFVLEMRSRSRSRRPCLQRQLASRRATRFR
jgi:hypothetical protein